MSMSEMSSHIPDLDIITFYGEKGTSIFSRISPWTKAIMLLMIILFITVSRSILVLSILYLATLMAYWLAGLPVKKLFQWYALPILFVLSLVLLLMWNEPGTPLFSVRLPLITITLTDNGALLVASLLLKALISVTYSLFFLMTTKYYHFSAMVYRLFPYPIDQIFLMSYRFIFTTLKMVDSMLKALRSRGGGLVRSARRQTGMFAEVFALTLIRSYDRAERINKAMEARGYSGKYVAASKVPHIGVAELLFLAMAGASFAYMAVFLKLPF
jgi:cobalt/nickel transport system permease protein